MSKPTIGIIGGGQLGSMLSVAAKNLNIKTVIISDDEHAPAQFFSDEFIYCKYNDEFKIEEFLQEIIKNRDYITNSFIKDNLNIFIELFFYKNINKSKNISYKIKKYFYLKLSKLKKYNLDLETFFIEFEDKLLSE